MFRLVVILQIAVVFRSELYFAVLNMVFFLAKTRESQSNKITNVFQIWSSLACYEEHLENIIIIIIYSGINSIERNPQRYLCLFARLISMAANSVENKQDLR